MAQQIIDVGSQPNAGDGDPLRIAFAKINDNFAELYTGGDVVSSYVASVAGKTGNVTLTVNDVIGAVSTNYVNNAVEAQVNLQVGAIVDSAPSSLDTLRELSQALQNDPLFGNVVIEQLSDRVSLLMGGTVTGPLLVSQTPTTNLQVTNKQYVDNQINAIAAGLVNLTAVYTKAEVDALLLNITNEMPVGVEDYGFISDPVENIEDFGSI